eukprot:TRINITY_DN85251_c0_g1_i1.p1 TRINITY_DN85251_c0_g1~~TRINITY_DN85251_c0_g1_i1.p1  ORF type:complete len:518 (-),score=61.56 TRINITY_DN85251_c0_g1_i1:16-1569(-)
MYSDYSDSEDSWSSCSGVVSDNLEEEDSEEELLPGNATDQLYVALFGPDWEGWQDDENSPIPNWMQLQLAKKEQQKKVQEEKKEQAQQKQKQAVEEEPAVYSVKNTWKCPFVVKVDGIPCEANAASCQEKFQRPKNEIQVAYEYRDGQSTPLGWVAIKCADNNDMDKLITQWDKTSWLADEQEPHTLSCHPMGTPPEGEVSREDAGLWKPMMNKKKTKSKGSASTMSKKTMQAIQRDEEQTAVVQRLIAEFVAPLRMETKRDQVNLFMIDFECAHTSKEISIPCEVGIVKWCPVRGEVDCLTTLIHPGALDPITRQQAEWNAIHLHGIPCYDCKKLEKDMCRLWDRITDFLGDPEKVLLIAKGTNTTETNCLDWIASAAGKTNNYWTIEYTNVFRAIAAEQGEDPADGWLTSCTRKYKQYMHLDTFCTYHNDFQEECEEHIENHMKVLHCALQDCRTQCCAINTVLKQKGFENLLEVEPMVAPQTTIAQAEPMWQETEPMQDDGWGNPSWEESSTRW